MTIWQASILSILGMSAVMAALYALGRKRNNMATVDLGWTAGVGLTTLFFALTFEQGWPLRKIIVVAMVLLWSGRLFSHILFNRIIGEEEEDPRYQALGKHWGDKAAARFFWFFQAQGPLAVLFAVPPILALRNPSEPFLITDVIGILIWLVAWSGETISDRQLEAFRRDTANKGKVCNIGLWRFSRHPNYFFEWLHWWAYVAMAITLPFGAFSLLGPVLMYLFLTRFTGIPYTEKRALISRGDAYRQYQQTTNRFFPWFPKNTA